MKTITFVIPIYNEEQRLKKTFTALSSMQLPQGLKLLEVIFVNDGSTDKSAKLIESTAKKDTFPFPIRLITYHDNQGKGFAIRQGMQYAEADYTLFFDADISTPLSELKKFMPHMKKDVPVIVGTRKNGKSTVIKHQPLHRELLGKGFTKLTQKTLRIGITDFTCGFKAFSKQAKEHIFPLSKIDGWSYDAEILFLAQKEGLSMQEVPVLWENDARTKVHLLSAIPQSFLDLIKIRVLHTNNTSILRPAFVKAS